MLTVSVAKDTRLGQLSSAHLSPSRINSSLCAHVLVGFARLNASSSEMEMETWQLEEALNGTVLLKNTDTRLKVLVSFGGWFG